MFFDKLSDIKKIAQNVGTSIFVLPGGTKELFGATARREKCNYDRAGARIDR